MEANVHLQKEVASLKNTIKGLNHILDTLLTTLEKDNPDVVLTADVINYWAARREQISEETSKFKDDVVAFNFDRIEWLEMKKLEIDEDIKASKENINEASGPDETVE